MDLDASKTADRSKYIEDQHSTCLLASSLLVGACMLFLVQSRYEIYESQLHPAISKKVWVVEDSSQFPTFMYQFFLCLVLLK